MKNVRIILAVVATATITATMVLGLILGPTWAIIGGTVGIIATLLASAYAIVKSAQTGLQRMAGVQGRQTQIETKVDILAQEIERWGQEGRAYHQQATARQEKLERALRSLTDSLDRQERWIARQERADVQAKLPSEVRRALEDLSLASRSLTVPQAHFDQLLRTISANTVRTEAALVDAVEEFKTIYDTANRRSSSTEEELTS